MASPNWQTLEKAIQGDLLRDPTSCGLYAADASLYEIFPQAVARPKTADDVVTIVKFASDHSISLTPRGAGTSLSGQSVGPGIVVDFSRYMNRVLHIDAERQMVRVQPGLVLESLNRSLSPFGLCFGPDVATINRATLGGMIGNNSAGSRSIVYGKTVDHVLELNCVLREGSLIRTQPQNAAGLQASANDDLATSLHCETLRIAQSLKDEILRRYPPILRRVSGYNLDEFVPEFMAAAPMPKFAAASRVAQRAFGDSNLSRLLVGAEGTLGLVTEAILQLSPLPQARALLVLHFNSLDEAVAAVGTLAAYEPSAIELLDGLIVRMARRNLEYRHYLDFVVGDPASLLIAEVSGEAADVAARIEAMEHAAQSTAAYHCIKAVGSRDTDHIWACRKAALPLLMSTPGERKPLAFVEDAAVDPARIAAFVRDFRDVLSAEGTEGAYYGHASVGCLHIRPMLDINSRQDRDRLQRISSAVADIVLKHQGAMSGEHGDGMARSYLNSRLFGPRIYSAFEQIKKRFDPGNIFNPGKIVDGPSPIDNLRRTTTFEPTIPTKLDFSAEGGLLAAAVRCNGAGVCRKTHSGVMCPSYMATREEEHSTRGRANALRQVLTNADSAKHLTGARLHEAFSLCLQCKGCKAECPSNVDVGKMKVELLAQRAAQYGVGLQTRVLANVHHLNGWGSRLVSTLGDWVQAAPFMSSANSILATKLLGLDGRRPLPKFATWSFPAWFDARWNDKHRSRKESHGTVFFFDDCLTNYLDPDTPRAAVLLLEAAGYEVVRMGLPCCGRAKLSQGMVDDARSLARNNAPHLSQAVMRGAPIIGCEPSCMMMLKDEYPELLGEHVGRPIADHAHTIEDFLAQPNHLQTMGIKAESGKLIYHGHCHHKAVVGVKKTQAFIKQFADNVHTLDAGCCGMAGSFGYTNYDVSMAIGERVLFPAVRNDADATVLASGFSCRQQILHGAGKKALHPAHYAIQQLIHD